ncbi:dehydroascorbate transporter [Salmonella enterica subsp. enterica]|uniref:Dehydroascorbate transporter n=1 Tax=Salmonella enterica I TaxID=59201 RepID=A0A379WKA8_SALET|nr:dehydroascorbate transporter [Salmonella enterica subsp. enterica]
MLVNAAKTTSVVMFLVAAAQVSAWLITIAELPMMVSDLLQPLVDSPRLLFIVIMISNYGRRYGDGLNANGVNSYPCIIAIS